MPDKNSYRYLIAKKVFKNQTTKMLIGWLSNFIFVDNLFSTAIFTTAIDTFPP